MGTLTAARPPSYHSTPPLGQSLHDGYSARVADSDSAAQDPRPQGRCVCGEKVTIADAHEITLPNGRPGWQGYCPVCGAPLFAIRRGSRASS